jgi:hypothetical protein
LRLKTRRYTLQGLMGVNPERRATLPSREIVR